MAIATPTVIRIQDQHDAPSLGAGQNGYALTWNNATVGGGVSNSASGFRSTVSGGYDNIASATHAVVSGGYSNRNSGVGPVHAGVGAVRGRGCDDDARLETKVG
jgi:FAD/FMN-containing dehydrogenase